MKQEKGSPEEIKALIDLAEDDLKNAHFNIKEGFNRQQAIVSAYYVVLNSSRAL